ncbi:hypothetical protein QTP70_016761, partial [Hemibagrus guttatus]
VQNMSTKVAVVTGANKGVGLAIVKGLCKAGFSGDVLLTARSVALGKEALELVKAEGFQNVFFHRLDICDQSSCLALRKFLKDKYGGLDVLVNNAGIAFKVDATEPFGEQAEVTIRTDFWGTLLRKTDLPEEELCLLMGEFVTAAQSGTHEAQGWSKTAYGTSKIGVTVLSRIQARVLDETRPNDGILLNACCPGWVRTDMAGSNAPKSTEEGAETPVYLALLPDGAKLRFPPWESLQNRPVCVLWLVCIITRCIFVFKGEENEWLGRECLELLCH